MNPAIARGSTRRWIACMAAICLVAGIGQLAFAQQGRDVEVLQVRPNFYLIARAGGNIGVQIGDNGVVLVDSGSAETAPRVLVAIKKLTDKPIRFVINTSADPDHVGGNQLLSEAGVNLVAGNNFITANNNGHAAILAHDNVLFRMSAPTGKQSPYPIEAQPSETYSEGKHNLFLNGEPIETFYKPSAHTDGDSIVHFRRSDVLMDKYVAPAKCERFCCGWIAPLPNGIPPGLNCNQYGFVSTNPQ